MTGPARTFSSYFDWSRRRWRFVRWTRVAGAPLPRPEAEQLAKLLATRIVEHRLRGGSAHLVGAWARVVSGGPAYTAAEKGPLSAYLSGLDPGHDPEHLQASIGEYLWLACMVDDATEPPLVRIEGPKFHATAPGGDGLVIRRDGQLFFTLWEIKKHTGRHLTRVIRDGYDQLSSNATRYLAEYSAVGQNIADPEVARLYGTLVESWLNGSMDAHAGIAVATSVAPDQCFSTMGKHFSHLRGVDPWHGLLSAVHGLPAFSHRVAEILWTGL
jgi:hypothetical protein